MAQVKLRKTFEATGTETAWSFSILVNTEESPENTEVDPDGPEPASEGD